nr:MAG: terminase large subunit [Caudoviricetes sp.]
MPPKMIPSFAPARGSLRYRCWRGGRGSGKSFNVAKMAAIWGAIEPLRILCTRELQNSIKESFHAELKNAIGSCKWLSTQYDVGMDYLRHKTNGTEFMFKGLRHNIEAVKSMAQIDLLIVEEAETVPHSSWIPLLPTIRAPKSEVWIVWNPKRPNSWVAENFDGSTVPPRSMVTTVNHSDNPWFSQELEEQRVHDKSVMAPTLYNHIWEGAYLLDDDGSIIKSHWVEAAIDAHLLIPGMDEGRSALGFDVADDGKDKCATIRRKGCVANQADEWKGLPDELLKSCARAYHAAKPDKAHIIYDSIGVGAFAGSKFNELNTPNLKITHDGFNAGGKVTRPDAIYGLTKIKNKDYFSNIKSQMWWQVADQFMLTYLVVEAIKNGTPPPKFKIEDLISIDSKIEHLTKLKMELCTPLRDFDKLGRVKVESKEDLEKREVPSPNLADAFIMAYAPIRRGLNISPDVLR